MTGLVPFRQGRYADLPDAPPSPHPYFEAESRRVTVTDPHFGRTEARVVVHGSGPPLLLVHGLMTSSYSWRYVLEPLGRRFTLYAPDLVGAGASSKVTDRRYSAAATAGWLGALQEALGVRGCPVIGNSLGGYLCMTWALQDPGAMSRLVNLHSPGFPEARLWALKAALGIPGMKALLARVVRRDPLRWAHRNVHYYDELLKSIEEARAYGEPLATPDGACAFTRILHETVDPAEMRGFQRRLASERFPVPLLLVYAARDPMVPPSFGPRFARATGAPLVVLEEASHFAHVDATEAFLEAVQGFLGETASP